MIKSTIAHLATPRDEREDGFTLIEILVVIIIIGILAAVAIPIFLNQQKTARDSATVQDVRNLATNIETGKVADPDFDDVAVGTLTEAAGEVTFTPATGDPEVITGAEGTRYAVKVGDAQPIEVSVTNGTVLSVEGTNGDFVVEGWNENGREYVDAGSAAEYDSALGGMQ